MLEYTKMPLQTFKVKVPVMRDGVATYHRAQVQIEVPELKTRGRKSMPSKKRLRDSIASLTEDEASIVVQYATDHFPNLYIDEPIIGRVGGRGRKSSPYKRQLRNILRTLTEEQAREIVENALPR